MRNKFKIGNKINLGRKHTEEWKKNVSEKMKGRSNFWLKGKKISEEHRAKLKALTPWNKGLTKNDARVLRGAINLSKVKKGTTHAPHSIETRKKMSANSGQKGEKSWNWKGGITPKQHAIRMSFEYKLWREAVFERDNYTCVWCGIKFIKGITGRVVIHADHIKPFSLFPELRFAIDNGRTLCIDCHKTTDTYAGRILNKKQ